MTDRDRLINELKKAKNKCLIYESGGCLACKYRGQADCTLEHLADHLLANGVIVPPCKVGDTVYRLAHNVDKTEWKVADFWEVIKIEIYEDEIGIIDDSDNYFSNEDIGKTVFLTKEEAKAELEKRCNDG